MAGEQNELIITLPAQSATHAANLFPHITTADIMQATDPILPSPGSNGNEERMGRETETALTQSPLTANNQQAAQERRVYCQAYG